MSKQTTEERLLEMRQKIDEAKDEVNRLEGRKEHLFQQLEEEWDCETLEEAEQVLEELEEEIEQLDNKITQGIEELEEKYEFE